MDEDLTLLRDNLFKDLYRNKECPENRNDILRKDIVQNIKQDG